MLNSCSDPDHFQHRKNATIKIILWQGSFKLSLESLEQCQIRNVRMQYNKDFYTSVE